MAFAAVGLDGDDTLWHTESVYAKAQEQFRAILAPYPGADRVDEHLFAVQVRNIGLFGYGMKGFILSMIETALEVSDRHIDGNHIQRIIDAGREMLEHPVEPLDGVHDALSQLAGGRQLLLITKGDLVDQEKKIARSGLAGFFRAIAIVSEKDPATYRRVLAQNEIAPEQFVMVGNSVRSDITPVVEIGGCAVHVPYHITWAHEHGHTADLPGDRVRTIKRLAELPAALADLENIR